MRAFVIIILIRILKRFHILDHHRREATILECTRTNVGEDVLEDLLAKLMLQLDFKRVQRHLKIIQNRNTSDCFQPVPLNSDHMMVRSVQVPRMVKIRHNNLGIYGIREQVQTIQPFNSDLVMIRPIRVVRAVIFRIAKLNLNQWLRLVFHQVPNNLGSRDVPTQDAVHLRHCRLGSSLRRCNSFHHEKQFILALGQVILKRQPIFPALFIQMLGVDLEMFLDLLQLSNTRLKFEHHLRSTPEVAEVGRKHDFLETLISDLLQRLAVEQQIKNDDIHGVVFS